MANLMIDILLIIIGILIGIRMIIGSIGSQQPTETIIYRIPAESSTDGGIGCLPIIMFGIILIIIISSGI